MIAAIGAGLVGAGAEAIDADGLVAAARPRRPAHPPARARPGGRRDRRDRARAAAALGGFTAVHAMANTDPVADTAGVVEQVLAARPRGRARRRAPGRRGHRRAARASGWPSSARWPTRAARVRVFSDDGHCVADPLLMRRALEYVKAFDGVIAQHAQEPRLTEGAQMHEGEVSSRLGLTGWPAVAEEAIIARDALLAGHVGSRLHVCHVSTAGSRRGPALGQGARACGSPPRSPRTTCCSPTSALTELRPGVQGQPAAAHRRRRRGAAGRRSPTARSTCVATDHAPHAVRTRSASGRGPARACSAWRPRCRSWSQTMVETGLLDWARRRRPDVACARPGSAGLADHGRPLAVGRAGQPARWSTRTARWTVDAGAQLASRSRNTPVRRA